jgi:hypothetical protein
MSLESMRLNIHKVEDEEMQKSSTNKIYESGMNMGISEIRKD